MLILTVITMMILVMMSRHRVWVLATAAGALFTWALVQLMTVFERVLPGNLEPFSGVLAYMLVALAVMWMMGTQEGGQSSVRD